MNKSTEMSQRLEEACKDKVWAEKIRTATTWEEYASLLGEKNIEATSELKELFTTSHTGKTGELADDELEMVAGGWVNLLRCEQKFSRFWCELSFCPHRQRIDNKPDDNHDTYYCDLNYWEMIVQSGDGCGY